jgi:Ca2+-transporting ATPase
MALTAFAAFRIVGAFESRSLTASCVTPATFDSKQMNWIVLFEIVLMILVVGFDLLNKWLGTTSMTWSQWGLSMAPAGILFVAWELGKLVARRAEAGATQEEPAAAVGAAGGAGIADDAGGQKGEDAAA